MAPAGLRSRRRRFLSRGDLSTAIHLVACLLQSLRLKERVQEYRLPSGLRALLWRGHLRIWPMRRIYQVWGTRYLRPWFQTSVLFHMWLSYLYLQWLSRLKIWWSRKDYWWDRRSKTSHQPISKPTQCQRWHWRVTTNCLCICLSTAAHQSSHPLT